jgi:hypothetical protein
VANAQQLSWASPLQVIGGQGLGERCALSLVAPFSTVIDQAMALEHGVHGTDRAGVWRSLRRRRSFSRIFGGARA